MCSLMKPRKRHTQLLKAKGFFSMSDVIFIDDSRSDGRHFFGGRVCQLQQHSALAALPCQFLSFGRANFCPSDVPISLFLPFK
jgi:hypothetical protein